MPFFGKVKFASASNFSIFYNFTIFKFIGIIWFFDFWLPNWKLIYYWIINIFKIRLFGFIWINNLIWFLNLLFYKFLQVSFMDHHTAGTPISLIKPMANVLLAAMWDIWALYSVDFLNSWKALSRYSLTMASIWEKNSSVTWSDWSSLSWSRLEEKKEGYLVQYDCFNESNVFFWKI